MKNKILFIFSIISTTGLLRADIPKFKKSWEEELHEAAEYYWNPQIETLDAVKNDILSTSKKNHYQDKIASLPIMAKRYLENSQKESVSFALDIQQTFDSLKNKMSVPQEVEVAVSFEQSLKEEAFMGYDHRDRTVYMYPSSLDMSPSYRLYTLIHELTHAQQHMRMGMLGSQRFSQEHHSVYEGEADTNAAESIKCPLCMKAVLAYQLLRENTASQEDIASVRKDGYLMSDDLKGFLQKKSLADLCKVHKSVENPDIWSGLDTQEGCMEIYNKDLNDWSMLDRLS
jgi:hypothetical protein